LEIRKSRIDALNFWFLEASSSTSFPVLHSGSCSVLALAPFGFEELWFDQWAQQEKVSV
jgi:hypothetical protein